MKYQVIVMVLCLVTAGFAQNNLAMASTREASKETNVKDTAAETVRATALTSEMINKFSKGEAGDITVEFKSGDRLPMVFTAEGDLLEAVDAVPNFWTVKRDFFLRVERNQIVMSLDGKTYKPINQLVGGSISVGATADSGDPIANLINITFKAFLK